MHLVGKAAPEAGLFVRWVELEGLGAQFGCFARVVDFDHTRCPVVEAIDALLIVCVAGSCEGE